MRLVRLYVRCPAPPASPPPPSISSVSTRLGPGRSTTGLGQRGLAAVLDFESFRNVKSRCYGGMLWKYGVVWFVDLKHDCFFFFLMVYIYIHSTYSQSSIVDSGKKTHFVFMGEAFLNFQGIKIIPLNINPNNQ